VISVLLVDDHPMVRAGLRAFLAESEDIAVVGELGDGESAIRFVDRQPPDIVLMDLSMPEGDGIAATRSITAQHPEVKVVVLTSFVDRERVLDAVDAGAVGYLLKDADPEELMRSIRAASRGESPFAPRATLALLAERSERSPTPPALTDREREVLTLVGRGLSNKEIGRALGISEKTVKTHLGIAFQRIGVTDRTRAALWAQKNGLLDPATPR
jgi:DNA-binding NarL/FixJ family response regulator